MLRIHQTALELISLVAPIALDVGRYDADLARQLRQALSSVTPNIAEGAAQIGGRRRSHYAIALGSANEARSALMTATAWMFIDGIPAPVDAHFRAGIGTLHNCVHPKVGR